MKTGNNEENQIQSTNLQTAGKAFTIKSSAAAFKILTDGLYEDKISTIIREISCNAYDSHVAAGNTGKPFDIHFPEKLEPYFYVRDYGTGLSKQDIETIYTTYFDSTKSNSNDFIGAYGLGSKTPLAYTDQFLVTSYFHGIEYQYTVYVNDQGFPEIQLLVESETSEPDGLKVQLTIKSEDLYRFYKKAVTFYAGCGLTPNLINCGVFPKFYEEIKYEVVYQKGDIQLIDLKDTGLDNRIYARVGMVLYPVSEKIGDITQWRESFRQPEVQSYLDSLLTDEDQKRLLNDEGLSCYRMISRVDYQNAVIINFAIGDLSIAASRESLSLDKRTEKAFREKFLLQWLDIASEFVQQRKLAVSIEQIVALKKAFPQYFRKHLPKLEIESDLFSASEDYVSVDNYKFFNQLKQQLGRDIEIRGYVKCRSSARYKKYTHGDYCNFEYKASEDKFIGKIYIDSLSFQNICTQQGVFDTNNFYYIRVGKKENKQALIDQLKPLIPEFLQIVDGQSVFRRDPEKEKVKKVYVARKTDDYDMIIHNSVNYITNKKLDDSQLKEFLGETCYYLPSKGSKLSFENKNYLFELVKLHYPETKGLMLLRTNQVKRLEKIGFQMVDVRTVQHELEPKVAKIRRNASIYMEIKSKVKDWIYGVCDLFTEQQLAPAAQLLEKIDEYLKENRVWGTQHDYSLAVRARKITDLKLRSFESKLIRQVSLKQLLIKRLQEEAGSYHNSGLLSTYARLKNKTEGLSESNERTFNKIVDELIKVVNNISEN